MKWGVSNQETAKWTPGNGFRGGSRPGRFRGAGERRCPKNAALFISQAEMRAMKLPSAEAQRMIGSDGCLGQVPGDPASCPAGSQARFRARRIRDAELRAGGSPMAVNKTSSAIPSRTILFESGDKKRSTIGFQTGELIQVGMAVAASSMVQCFRGGIELQSGRPCGKPGAGEELYDELPPWTRVRPLPSSTLRTNPAVQSYNLKRVELVAKIWNRSRENEQETWDQTVCDNLVPPTNWT